jgi:hypothetical protein
MTLLEVLAALFVLSAGLLIVPALIPLGAISLKETVKSDRTGACGRAALRQVKAYRMLSPVTNTLAYNWWPGAPPAPTSPTVVPSWPATWQAMLYPNLPANDPTTTPASMPSLPSVFVIDPLGVGAAYENAVPSGDRINASQIGATASVNGLDRITLASIAAQRSTTVSPNPESVVADQFFRWRDDLSYVRAKDWKGTGTPPNGDRPNTLFVQSNGSINYSPTTNTTASSGEFSWFLTVGPSPLEQNLPVAQKRLFTVCVVVCYQRVLSKASRSPSQARPRQFSMAAEALRSPRLPA